MQGQYIQEAGSVNSYVHQSEPLSVTHFHRIGDQRSGLTADYPDPFLLDG